MSYHPFPPGITLPFAGASAPAGWLMCDGAPVSRTTFATLFAVIGTQFGAGDGSTTFNVPNQAGRALCAAGTGAPPLTPRALGAAVGEETHVLTISEFPAHAHGVTDPGHSHPILKSHNGGTGGVFDGNELGTNAAQISPGTVANTTGITIVSAGSGVAHNNMQPAFFVNVIIKT
jgi:microcystin-dependent protein